MAFFQKKKTPSMPRATTAFRNFCFTHNNYANTDIEDRLDCKYIVYGKEVGASGTPHLQGFVSFKNAKTKSAVIRLMPGCHIEVAQDPQKAILYCKKGDMSTEVFKELDCPDEDPRFGVNADVTERGTKPREPKEGGEDEKARWKFMLDLAKSGDLETLQDEEPEAFVRHYATFHRIKVDNITELPPLDKLDNYWVYGPPETGKTLWVNQEMAPGAYKKNNSKWWDGYMGQEDVLMDEIEKTAANYNMGHYLKIWGQHGSFIGEIKGKSIVMRPKRFFITSNYSIDEVFGGDDMLVAAIKRRFQQIEFVGKGKYVRHPYAQSDKSDINFEQVEPSDQVMCTEPDTCEQMGTHVPACAKHLG